MVTLQLCESVTPLFKNLRPRLMLFNIKSEPESQEIAHWTVQFRQETCKVLFTLFVVMLQQSQISSKLFQIKHSPQELEDVLKDIGKVGVDVMFSLLHCHLSVCSLLISCQLQNKANDCHQLCSALLTLLQPVMQLWPHTSAKQNLRV